MFRSLSSPLLTVYRLPSSPFAPPSIRLLQSLLRACFAFSVVNPSSVSQLSTLNSQLFSTSNCRTSNFERFRLPLTAHRSPNATFAFSYENAVSHRHTPHENRGKNPPVLRPAPFAKGGYWGISRRCSNHGTSFSCDVLYRLVHELLCG
jgi:hypothetical protein